MVVHFIPIHAPALNPFFVICFFSWYLDGQLRIEDVLLALETFK